MSSLSVSQESTFTIIKALNVQPELLTGADRIIERSYLEFDSEEGTPDTVIKYSKE